MLTQKFLKECVIYIPDTGIFIWKKRPNNHFKSDAICLDWNRRYANKVIGNYKDRYLRLRIYRKAYLLHRLAYLYMKGYFPKEHTDHIDGNTKNNAWINLREATYSENQQNRKRGSKNKKNSYMLGTSYNPKINKYVAQIVINKKIKHIGYFKTEIDAHEAYLKEKRILHPSGTI